MEKRYELFTTLIAKINRSIHKIKSQEMNEFSLKSPHVSCLYYLYKNGSMTAKELRAVCDEDKAAISRTIEFLEQAGYVELNSIEKRYKLPLRLTDQGFILGKKIAEKVDRVVSEVSVGVDDFEREIMYKSLQNISNNLEKVCGKGE